MVIPISGTAVETTQLCWPGFWELHVRNIGKMNSCLYVICNFLTQDENENQGSQPLRCVSFEGQASLGLFSHPLS